MQLIRVLFFVSLATGLAANCCGQLQSVSRADRELARSLFESVKTNAIAFESCDVLIRESSNFDSVENIGEKEKNADGAPGIFEESVSLVRIAASYKTKSFATASINENTYLDMSVKENNAVQRQVAGICFDSANRRIFILDHTGQKSSRGLADIKKFDPNYEKQLSSRFFDARTFGVWPRNGGKPLSSVLSQYLNKLAEGNGLRLVKKGRDWVDVTYTSYEIPEKKYLGRHVVRFDLASSVPVKIRGESWIESLQLWSFEFEQELRWQDKDGIMMPVSISSSRPLTKTDVHGKKWRARIDKTTEFHWHSVNRSLPPNLFDGSRFQSLEDARRWVDPKSDSGDSFFRDDEPKSIPK